MTNRGRFAAGSAPTGPSIRELEVLRLLELPNASYASVADDLDISTRTVSAHLSNLYAKLGVNSALQARAVLERGRPRV